MPKLETSIKMGKHVGKYVEERKEVRKDRGELRGSMTKDRKGNKKEAVSSVSSPNYSTSFNETMYLGVMLCWMDVTAIHSRQFLSVTHITGQTLCAL